MLRAYRYFHFHRRRQFPQGLHAVGDSAECVHNKKRQYMKIKIGRYVASIVGWIRVCGESHLQRAILYGNIVFIIVQAVSPGSYNVASKVASISGTCQDVTICQSDTSSSSPRPPPPCPRSRHESCPIDVRLCCPNVPCKRWPPPPGRSRNRCAGTLL